MTRVRRAIAFALPLLLTIPVVWFAVRPSAQSQLIAAPPEATATPTKDVFAETVRPIFTQFCITCHNDKKISAGLTLEPFKTSADAKKARDLWETVKEMVANKQMPPKGKPQPTDEQRKSIITWIDSVAIKVDCGLARDPGRPTIRRLNRNEYNNTIRDLVGVDFKPADNFPSDDVGYGFDNIGDVLSMPPILLEKYLTAAETILDKAIVLPKQITVVRDSFRPQNVRSTLGPLSKQNNRIFLSQTGAAIVSYDFVNEGEYIFRARAYGDQVGKDLPKLNIELDKKPIESFNVDAVEAKPKSYETTKTKVTAGRHDVIFSFANPFEDKTDPEKKKTRSLSLVVMEIEGPFKPVPKPAPETHRRIFVAAPSATLERDQAARKILQAFATRAYRRPVKPAELDRLVKLFKFADGPGEIFEGAVKHALKAVLVSPHFLFRIERDAEPNNPEAVHPIGQFELASRLSYFLWSSMPDDELFKLAEANQLRNPGLLEAQVRRMLTDPKSAALVENFAGQWLMLRSLATVTPDKNTFKSFDTALKTAMVRETELYFDHVMRDDRSILEFLDSDYTFVNDRLARHYGMPGSFDGVFKKVKLADNSRGGILTHASILTVTSNPTRTSPVKRGKWILENILGTPPPPPPPDVPELDSEMSALTGTLRQRMEKHRENPNCAVCHAKLDPLGFGLENFDAIGALRQFDGKAKIDPSGELPDGAKFSGPAEMRKVLVAKGDLFRKNLADKMLTYALGRGLEYYDRCAVDDILTATKQGQDRFSALMVAVVKTDAFQKRRGGTMTKKE